MYNFSAFFFIIIVDLNFQISLSCAEVFLSKGETAASEWCQVKTTECKVCFLSRHKADRKLIFIICATFKLKEASWICL